MVVLNKIIQTIACFMKVSKKTNRPYRGVRQGRSFDVGSLGVEQIFQVVESRGELVDIIDSQSPVDRNRHHADRAIGARVDRGEQELPIIF